MLNTNANISSGDITCSGYGLNTSTSSSSSGSLSRSSINAMTNGVYTYKGLRIDIKVKDTTKVFYFNFS